MRCPFCNNTDTQVKDSRPSDDGRVIRRRRECTGCGRRFTTFENFQIQQVVVVKKDGRREMFDREKLSKSILTALRKRPVTQVVINDLVSDIEQKLGENGRNEVKSDEIGDTVIDSLKDIDFVGFIRYASVYNDFDKPEDFNKLLNNLS